jgi:capsular exopolysaccharide synthesis family protein
MAKYEAQVAAPSRPNLVVGVLRRWPWWFLGLIIGAGLGYLYQTQWPPTYQSTAQLSVSLESGAKRAGEPRTQDDPVGTQLISLKSESVLRRAAEKRLDEEKPFAMRPPDATPERIAFLREHFDASRQSEPGTNSPTSVLLLGFKAANPTDAPKYLRAIIAAYRDELSDSSKSAPNTQLTKLNDEITRLTKSIADAQNTIQEAQGKLRGVVNASTGAVSVPGISQEELSTIRQRIASNLAAQINLKLRDAVVAKELADIAAVGNTREPRLALMAKLGVPVEKALLNNILDPDTMLAHLKLKKRELSTRLGPGHPDMISLNSQIKTLEDELNKRTGPPDDELERYRRKLENEKSTIATQVKVLDTQISTDEDKAQRMAPLQATIESAKATLNRDTPLLQDAERERERLTPTGTANTIEVKDLSKPGDGVQVAPVLLHSVLLGIGLGLLLGCGLALCAELAGRGGTHTPPMSRSIPTPAENRTSPPPVPTPPATPAPPTPPPVAESRPRSVPVVSQTPPTPAEKRKPPAPVEKPEKRPPAPAENATLTASIVPAGSRAPLTPAAPTPPAGKRSPSVRVVSHDFLSPEEIRSRIGTPILGRLPHIQITAPTEVTPLAKLDPLLVTLLSPHSNEAEAIREVCNQLLKVNNHVHQAIQITSPSVQDGKSTLAANLAISLARHENRVVLVDCDFRNPRVHTLFALPDSEHGFASVVDDQTDLGAAIQSCEIENLSLLPCGWRPSDPAELFSRRKFQEVLDDLRLTYDIVILDAPPVFGASETAAIAQRANGVVMVFRQTEAMPVLERTKETLVAVNARLLGLVVNDSLEPG